MGLGDDLTAESITPYVRGHVVRSYPAAVSTEADAAAWARSGAPHGAVVVADYQTSARGRGGQPWHVQPGSSLGFSIVLRVSLPVQREGWLYTMATTAAAGVLGAHVGIGWPDRIVVDDHAIALVAVRAQLQAGGVEGWAVCTMLVNAAGAPRGPLLGELVHSLDATVLRPEEETRAVHRERCVTLGRQVRARLMPVGPTGEVVEGKAVDVLGDGALVVATATRRVAVRPTHVGVFEAAPH